MGRTRPGDMGFDIVHINTHKTFATPHGGGGPGAGPVGVVERLIPFLPVPRVERDGDRFYLDEDAELSIGRMHGFHGNVGVLVRAYVYVFLHGRDGLREVSDRAVLNANYLAALARERSRSRSRTSPRCTSSSPLPPHSNARRASVRWMWRSE